MLERAFKSAVGHQENLIPKRQEAIKRAQAILEAAGVVDPVDKSDKGPVSIDEIWESQAENLANNFAPYLNLSLSEYIDRLPKFTSIEEQEIPHMPLIVETRVPLVKMAQAADVLPSSYISDLLNSKAQIDPYSVNVSLLPKSDIDFSQNPEGALSSIEKKGYRACNLVEGINFAFSYPEAIGGSGGIILLGTNFGFMYFPQILKAYRVELRRTKFFSRHSNSYCLVAKG